MVPSLDTASRGRGPARTSVSMDDDDEWAVFSDAESVSGCSTASYDFSRTAGRQDCAPVFLKGEQGKPVYEAWNIHYFPRKRDTVDGFRVLGINVENYEEFRGRTDVRPQPSSQSALAGMHMRGIEDFGAKQKRCWATRPFRGKGKTYEEHLEERCGKLPGEVKDAIVRLLSDRGSASSTPLRARTWTVVCLQEQLRHRFAQADFTTVRRHKFRLWKNPDREEPLLYSVVIRGLETSAATGEDDVHSFAPFSNPWRHADMAEFRRRTREQRDERDALRRKRSASPASYPAQARSASPPSYRSMSVRSRYGSPSAASHNDRYESPPPYRRYTRGESPVGSRSPNRIRMRPRFNCDFDGAPTPPISFTPPPAVAGYGRPSGVSAPPPHIHSNPDLPRPPGVPNGFPQHPFGFPQPPYATAPPHSWSPPRPFNPFDTLPTPGNCVACRASPGCPHYPTLGVCTRPVNWWGGIRYHPPCNFCTRYRPPPPAAPMAMPMPPVPGPAAGMTVPCHYSLTVPPPPPPPRAPVPHWPPPAFPRTPSPVGPMPPTPNPYSPLSTPSLSSRGESAPGSDSAMSAPQTPVSGSVVGSPAAEVVGEDDASSSRSEAGRGDERLGDVNLDDLYD